MSHVGCDVDFRNLQASRVCLHHLPLGTRKSGGDESVKKHYTSKAVSKGNDKTAQLSQGQNIVLALKIESSIPVQSDFDGVGRFLNQPANPVADCPAQINPLTIQRDIGSYLGSWELRFPEKQRT